ncbi:hypothetical protein AXF42_Ash000874 [Apostasia shenzhenica]|uniref:Uncharacterized protein n=1 Tax=Apostasia shenzhenica TaxID=1088818 RepID=A0A2I0ATA6_9ASPA|nr:hypothetical protein AXF42_Ash000874 [Apostasia shenzhenica]
MTRTNREMVQIFLRNSASSESASAVLAFVFGEFVLPDNLDLNQVMLFSLNLSYFISLFFFFRF